MMGKNAEKITVTVVNLHSYTKSVTLNQHYKVDEIGFYDPIKNIRLISKHHQLKVQWQK